jgi:hypothetical protein
MVKKNKIFVNGPIMAVRLEGKVNNINKVIYLFGDHHSNVNNQTKCPTYDSVEFPYYFIKIMAKTNKNSTFDFFMEIPYENIYLYDDKERHKQREKYAVEIGKFFRSNINVNNDKKNNNKYDNKIENLRIYNIDIRNHFSDLHDDILENNLDNIDNELLHYLSTNDYTIENLKNVLNDINKSIELTFGILLNNVKEEDNSLYESNEKYKNIKHYSLKLLNDYKNSNVRNKLLDETLILSQIKKYIKDIKELSVKLEQNMSLFNEIIKKYNNKIYKNNYNLDRNTRLAFVKENIKMIDDILRYKINLYVYIMDLYFLRKFLDKDNITNVIGYTGILHTYNYIWILVKNFDFKITHSTNKDVSIDEINTIIKNNEYDVDNFTKIIPNELLQCIDMSSFPKYFK